MILTCVGKEKGGYYHELFLFGQQKLAYNIQRVVLKGQNRKGKICEQVTPSLCDVSEAKVPVGIQSNQTLPSSLELQRPSGNTSTLEALYRSPSIGFKSNLEPEIAQRSLEIFQKTPKRYIFGMDSSYGYNNIRPIQSLSSYATVSLNSFSGSVDDEANALARLVTMRILDSRARSHLAQIRR